MAVNNPYAQYKNTQIQTATPGQLILMLYDGAIKFCKLSRKSMEEKNMSNVNRYLIRVQDIISELSLSLDMKLGGEISKQLKSLYDYMIGRLVDANLQKNIAILDEVQEMIEELREAWIEVIKKTGGVRPRG